MRIMSLLLTVAMVRVCAPRLTALRVMQVQASRAFAVNFIAHSISAPEGYRRTVIVVVSSYRRSGRVCVDYSVEMGV
ncbi:hypothetical protein PFUM301598_52820 [Pseudomonas fluorescens]